MLPPSTLLKSGLAPTLRDFNHFLLFLSRSRRFKAVIHVFSQLTSNGFGADARTRVLFASALMKEKRYSEVADFLENITGRSEVIQRSCLLDSLVWRVCDFDWDPEMGFSLLKHLMEIDDAFVPSSRSFCLLITCFSRLGKMDRVIDSLELMSDCKLGYAFDNFVCSSVISGFLRIGEPELAFKFYEDALHSGKLVPNTVTCTAVLSTYFILKKFDRVSDLVAWMEENRLPLDVVFYSNWIYGCFTEGLICEAFNRFREMVHKEIKLDCVGYTILIDGFSKGGNVEKAVGFLYKMRRDGIEPNLVTYTAVILGFCKKGRLDEAFATFSLLKKLGVEADEFTYAILIDGVCRRGDFDLVFQLLDEMVKKGVNVSVVTYNTIINGLCKAGKTVEADDLSKVVYADVITYTTLLHGYIQECSTSGILETKWRFEASGIGMDIIMCNVLIKSMLMVGLFEDAFVIYKGLVQINLKPNYVTFYTLIDGYCKAGWIDETLEIFDDFRKTSNASGACYNCVILGLCRKGFVDMAIDVFIEYIEKGMPLDRTLCMELFEATMADEGAEGIWKIVYRMEHIGLQALCDICTDSIWFLCETGFPEVSWRILLLMRNKGLELTDICYYAILRMLLFKGKGLLARLIFPMFVKSWGMSNPSVSKIILYYLCLVDAKKGLLFLLTLKDRQQNITIPNTVFKMLMNSDRILDAYKLLMGAENHLPYMNVVDYSIMIDTLCKGRHLDKALNLCSLAKKKGIGLSISAYNSVINGLCHQGCLVEAFRLYDSLERIGVRPTEVTYGTLIDALVREGLLCDARMLFEKMFLKDLIPSTHIYNSLINGYCKLNQLEEALKLYKDFEARSLEPDEFTVAELINGYCQKGDLEGALKLFFGFQSKGLSPDFQGFMYLVRGLCGKGRMEESRGVLRKMLQTRSVVDLLSQVDLGIECDSVENLLVLLCDQGSINESVAVLDAVESMLFSRRRNFSHHTWKRPVPSIVNQIDLNLASEDTKKLESIIKSYASEDGRTAMLNDFDSFYSLIYSLCSKGDIPRANNLTKLLIGL